jgi:hypothetical protein
MAAIPLDLSVAVSDDDSSPLLTNGEIYDGKQALVVSHVIATQGWESTFVLDPGHYEYRFHVENAGGKFTITIVRTDLDKTVGKSPELSTGDGFHFSFKFEIA